jgi:AcrR family transcriptional regulator
MVGMARPLDKEERRRQVSEAAWRVLVRDGLAALSVRNVATEAGLPPSSLRYTFPTQASVREHAASLVVERLGQRVNEVNTTLPDWPRAVLMELLPLDAERRMEIEVFLALGTAAMTDASLRRPHLAVHLAAREVCVRALCALRDGADISDIEVEGLHALVDGLALHIVRQEPNADTAWATQVLETHLVGMRIPQETSK